MIAAESQRFPSSPARISLFIAAPALRREKTTHKDIQNILCKALDGSRRPFAFYNKMPPSEKLSGILLFYKFLKVDYFTVGVYFYTFVELQR